MEKGPTARVARDSSFSPRDLAAHPLPHVPAFLPLGPLAPRPHMTHRSESDPLRPMLAETEKELGHRLEEACAAQNVSAESTGELMRLEETLLDAAKVAKQAVSLRRRLRSREDTDTSPSSSEAAPPRRATVHHPASVHERFVEDSTSSSSSGSGPGLHAADHELSRDIAVRELRDAQGVEWRVWEVVPKISSSKGAPGERLGDYGEGWLAFESRTGAERRRLPHIPDGWKELGDSDLEKLLDRADVAPVRRKGPDLDLHSPS